MDPFGFDTFAHRPPCPTAVQLNENAAKCSDERLTGQQVGGNHYAKLAIQPYDYINANGLSYGAGNVVKYVTRYRDKNGAQDLRKAIHYLRLMLAHEYGEAE